MADDSGSSSTLFPLFIFTVVTIAYYVFRPKIKLSDYANNDIIQEKNRSGYIYLGFYVLAVIITQFFANSYIIINKCQGSLSDNFLQGALLSLGPWAFIFTSIVVILIVFPGFKSAFSNVIGYFAVSSEANNVLNELLVNTNIQQSIEQSDAADRPALQHAADAIIKLCGNASIMINQIVPENFLEYWAILKPLMKDIYKTMAEDDTTELGILKNRLYSVVKTRDNIGEIMWYFYTALLLISIVQYNIITRGCSSNSASMVSNYQAYLDNENTKNAQNSLVADQQYSNS